MNLAKGVGGNIDKSQVLSAVEKYEKYHASYGGQEEERKANYVDMVNKFYDLATSFYEYGWGQSFHFAPRWKGESVREGIKRHEHFIALQLCLKPGQKVLDVGCGIGGPLREISRFSSTSITGLNNNEYQITRAKADFMKMPFPDNNFDAVYAIEATCHAPDVEEIEVGDGLPDIRLTTKCVEALKQAGFEVIWEKDLAVDSPVPWYFHLDASHFSLSTFPLTSIGRFFTRSLIRALEFVRLAPRGSLKVQEILQRAADGLLEGGNFGFHVFASYSKFLVRGAGSCHNEFGIRYEKYHVCHGGQEEERKANYTDMVNKYYDLSTSFYEFGWGQSFHFAHRWKGESLQESIKRHEHFLALQLGLKPGQKVLDVGCGIGGPLREISRFSSTSVTGLNNNEYQITRGEALNRIAGVDKTCNFVKAEIEIGDGLPDIRLTTKCAEALKQAGFEVKGLEYVGFAPKGSLRVQEFLEKAADGLVEGGKKEIFTPMYFFLARKPESSDY
ncbi:hypothetical protein JHK87_032400 [Glycine soja]|nr:hypothetical protein JHK87_032400 [Glycine soja]